MASYTLAEPTQAWIDAQVAAGRAPNGETYLADLVARDRELAEQLAALHAALDEGEASGISDLTVEQVFEKARRDWHAEAR